jgi:hypothetical protein
MCSALGEGTPGLTRRGTPLLAGHTNFFRASVFLKRKPGGGTGLPRVMRRLALGVPGDECAAWLALLHNTQGRKFRIDGLGKDHCLKKHMI